MQGLQSTIYLVAMWLVLLLLLMVAIATTFYVPEYQALFDEFGTTLPAVTQIILQGPIFIWTLPTATILLLVSFHKKNSIKWGALLLVVALGASWLPTAYYGLYQPIVELAELELDAGANK